jgi:protein TonB
MAMAESANEPLPPKPASPVRVSKGVSGGEVLSRTQAVYPTIARQVNAAGEVVVAVSIYEEGRVISAKAVKGHPLLRGAAEEAAKKWIFKPTLLDGKPVKQTGNLTFIFTPPR